MNPDDFVRAIERCVRDSAVTSTLSNIQSPPGQRPDPDLMRASHWFAKLKEDDRVVLEWVIRWTADHATHNFLCVIDGAAAIESGPEKGHLELYYVRDQQRHLLNDRGKEPLNDKLEL